MTSSDLPAAYARAALSIQEVEPATLVVSLARGCQRVLNVGPSWGRDFYALTRAGHQVFNLDVARQSHLPRLAIANIARAAPFADQAFDAVLMAEVLEHIWNDFNALREARRVLKDDGKLIVTVPFYSDAPAYHVRLHSPASIQRLIRANGFEIVEYIERGGVVTFPRLVHGLRRLAALVGLGDAFMQAVVRFDTWLGRRHGLLKHSPAFGGCIAAVKSDVVNFEQLNRIEFEH